jgi:hypothetical protein
MSQLVKTKRQANFKGFKRFGAFKGLVEFHSRFKRPNLQTNSSNKLLGIIRLNETSCVITIE